MNYYGWCTEEVISLIYTFVCTISRDDLDTFIQQHGFSTVISMAWCTHMTTFSVPQIEYPLGGRSKKGLLPVDSWYGTSIVTSDYTIMTSRQIIVLPRKPATGSIHDYLFCFGPLVGILFEVLSIVW